MSATMAATTMSSRRFVRSHGRWQNGNQKVSRTDGQIDTCVSNNFLQNNQNYNLKRALQQLVGWWVLSALLFCVHQHHLLWTPPRLRALCLWQRSFQPTFSPTNGENINKWGPGTKLQHRQNKWRNICILRKECTEKGTIFVNLHHRVKIKCVCGYHMANWH